MTQIEFPPTRTAALERLQDFVPHAGRDYTSMRNHDLPGHPHVSTLSPYIRHRALTEEDVLRAVLAKWAPSTAEKFIQEVVWRTYFKGWLERRPGIWANYRKGVDAAWNRVQTESGLRQSWESACRGETGIDPFDYWAQELAQTGYLHNHARMWFASIWIFTLKLPWELGADFFLRHLLDGDPASNTLGWRWVAGLHTKGKHYIARPGNIAKFTGGRFALTRLDTEAEPLDGPPHPEPLPLRETAAPDRDLRTGFLVTEDDTSFGFAFRGHSGVGTFVLNGAAARSPLAVSNAVKTFTDAILADAIDRHSDLLGPITFGGVGQETAQDLETWVSTAGIEQIVMPYLTEGPARDKLLPQLNALSGKGTRLVEMRRPYDSRVWPLCTAGFFKVKKAIPSILEDLNLG